MHYENAVDEIILPNAEDIIKNEWVGPELHRRRYVEDLLRKRSGMRPKSNSRIGELAHSVLIAVEQEKRLNNDIQSAQGTLTSNIGAIISTIIEEQCNNC